MPVIISCGRWQDRGWFLQKLGGSWRWHLGGTDCDGGGVPTGQWVHLTGTYDGENCSYEGPETVTLSDEISLTLVNDSADAVILKVNLVPPDRLTDFEPLVGSDTDYSSETALRPTFYAEASPFGESSALAFLPAPGTYVVECVLGGAIPIHVWWLAALEVTP